MKSQQEQRCPERIVQMPHISQVVLMVALGIIVGIGVIVWYHPARENVWFVVGLGGILCITLFFRAMRAWMALFFLLGLLLGAERVEYFLAQAQHDHAGEQIDAQVEVMSVPRVRERFVSAYARYGTENILLRLPKHAPIVYGSVVHVTCEREVPEAFHQFDYPKYLLMHRVNYICTARAYSVDGVHDTVLARIASVRRALESHITQRIPAPESALGNGLIFGGDDRLSPDIQNDFALTGMSHIVAVSGYNVTIIVLVITNVGIFFGLWRKQAAVVSILAIILFVAMIGFPASGVRAAVMGTLVLFAVIYGRATHAFGAVVLAGALMLLWSPLQLRYDIGFQLSFLAVIGILLFYPLFERGVIVQHKSFTFFEILFLTISAQLFVLPVILFHFHMVSLSSLITNVLVLPIIPLTMLAVFLAAILGTFSSVLAAVWAWLGYGLLHYELFVISFFAQQSWNRIQIDTFSLPLALLYYMMLLIIAYYFYHKDDLTHA